MTRDLLGILADVLAATGTVAAVIVALKVSLDESRARAAADLRAQSSDERAERLERERTTERARLDAERAEADRLSREREHRTQALQVIAWPERRETAQWRGVGNNRVFNTEQVVRVVNASSAVVFDAAVDVLRVAGTYERDLSVIRLLPSGADVTTQMPVNFAAGDSVFLRFRDLRGTWWRRNQNGHLEETLPNGLVKP